MKNRKLILICSVLLSDSTGTKLDYIKKYLGDKVEKSTNNNFNYITYIML
jgi:hypothetical protein